MALAAGIAAIGIAGLAPVIAEIPASTGVPAPPHAQDPPPAHTGGFGEPTCGECHMTAESAVADGSVTVDVVPRYELGQPYRIVVILRHRGMEAAGFQLSARFADGSQIGRQAGSLDSIDDRVETTESGSHVYAHHTAAGTRPGAEGVARWALRWTAPSDPSGSVIFHVAANAANYDDSELGDVIYTTSTISAPFREQRSTSGAPRR